MKPSHRIIEAFPARPGKNDPCAELLQVLEGLTKTSKPSRAEVSDAVMGERAECVMLNNGPHVVQAIQMLDNSLQRMQGHQRKKRALLRRLHW